MIQNFFAKATQTTKLVDSLSVLKRLEKAGHITLHAHTGQKVEWYGQKTTAWYIDSCTKSRFTYRDREFVVEYRSGSFYQYVYAVLTEEEIRMKAYGL